MIDRRTIAAAGLICMVAFASVACADTGYQSGVSKTSTPSTVAPETGSPRPLTLADPELREIVSHFKHPEDTSYPAAPPSVAVSSFAYPALAFGSVRPYWPPVVVGQPPRPAFAPILTPFAFPLLAPFLRPAILPFMMAPRFDFITPGF